MNWPTQRFTTRAESYVRSRPDYPAAVLEALEADCDLSATAQIADIGAGTGIFTEQLLKRGFSVVAVEPNEAMRDSLVVLLGRYPALRTVDGTAEATSLPPQSVDMIVVAQAFHWFDPVATRREFTRVLRPGGSVALLWNLRDTESTPFLRGFDALLLRYAPEYPRLKTETVNESVLQSFFEPNGFKASTLYHEQRFDLLRLQELVRSTSYAPDIDHPNHAPMMTTLSDLFAAHESGGAVHIRYTVRLFCGRL
jgi:SAM-dependent methyltransferase